MHCTQEFREFIFYVSLLVQKNQHENTFFFFPSADSELRGWCGSKLPGLHWEFPPTLQKLMTVKIMRNV